ncbi:hypothetical protein, partial [Mesorhizobium sp. M2E.F.Ca.ET.154.01.1.1]
MTRISAKSASWALIFILYMSVAFTATISHAEDVKTNPKHTAAEYLSSLDKYEPILVWPTMSRPYEVVGKNSEIAGSVASYIENRRNTFHLV